jgi:hypothetical protein
MRYRSHGDNVFLWVFDLIKLNGADLRRDPLALRILRCCIGRCRTVSSDPPRSKPTISGLISTFLINIPNPALYSLTDRIVRPDRNIPLDAALQVAENDPIWANRGRAIQGYAILEQSLCRALAQLGDMKLETALTIFYRITNSRSRTSILERLLHKKHGTRFNLFWDIYFKQLGQIDLTRNEIAHWLSALNAALNDQNIMIVGVTLIHPGSLGEQQPKQHLTSNDLIEFSTKCQVLARLCNMFYLVTSNHQLEENTKKTWLEIFQQPLVYPLPADRPLNQMPATPDSPPQSSPA